MKTAWPLLAAALLLPLAAPAHAQAPQADAPVRLLDDPAGDVKVDLGGQPQGPQGRWAATDLTGLDALETAEDITLTLHVGSLKTNPEVPFAESTIYSVAFQHRDRQFTLFIFRNVAPSASYFAYLSSYDPATGRYSQASSFVDLRVDADAGTLSATLGRDLLVDAEGNAPHPEVPFTGWHATATSGSGIIGLGGFCPARGACLGTTGQVGDRMPDQGNGTTDLTLRYGIVQSGYARLSSEDPTRASNGEATTFVYQVRGISRMEGNQTFALTASGLPAGWSVKLPAEHITVPGNGSVLFPVLVTVPFAHQHGTYQKFLLEMAAARDPGSVGRIQLGVRYTNPPQPAGHHNTLWLHSQSFNTDPTGLAGTFQPQSGLYMNAAPPEEDPADAKLDVPAELVQQQPVPLAVTYRWSTPLSPELLIGLDFHPGTGNVSVPVKTVLPMLGATLGGHLVYLPTQAPTGPGGIRFGGGEEVTLADVKPAAPVDVPANSADNILRGTIALRPEAGYIAYAKGAGLRLDLEVTFTRADGFGSAEAPQAQPGGILDLPLNEYHDRVAQVFASNATLALDAASSQDRTTNPGKTVLYNLTLSNHGPAAMAVNLELTGTHLLWVSLLEPTKIPVKLAANQTLPVRVVVRVPPEADKGDTADLVLSATNAANLNVRSLARLYTTVDTGKQYPDDALLVNGIEAGHAKKGSPGLEAPLAALGLLAAVLAARRRR